MASGGSIGRALAWPFLAPGNFACDAMGVSSAEHRDLVRMLVNSLVWMVIGIAVVIGFSV